MADGEDSEDCIVDDTADVDPDWKPNADTKALCSGEKQSNDRSRNKVGSTRKIDIGKFYAVFYKLRKENFFYIRRPRESDRKCSENPIPGTQMWIFRIQVAKEK